MLRSLKDNQRGIVFVTVLMVILVAMVLAVSVLSLNISQVVSTEDEVKRLQAQSLALGAIPYFYTNQLSSSSGNLMTYTETLGNTMFTVVANLSGPGLGGYQTNALTVNVSF